jgi:hypothetical protein
MDNAKNSTAGKPSFNAWNSEDRHATTYRSQGRFKGRLFKAHSNLETKKKPEWRARCTESILAWLHRTRLQSRSSRVLIALAIVTTFSDLLAQKISPE